MKALMTAGFVAIALAIAASCLYTVDERELVIITLFGEIVDVQAEPGLRVKGPLLWEVHRLPRWVLEWDGYANTITTRDKKFIYVDTFARWRIADPHKFFVSVRDERGAQARLDDIIDGATRDVITEHVLIEVVRNSNREMLEREEGYGDEPASEAELAEHANDIVFGREKLAKLVHEGAAPKVLDEFGIELLDVQFKRINYTEEVGQKVFERMISERKRIAELFRAEGKKEAAEILGKQQRELKRIESEAYKTAEELRGAADAQATRIYADTYGRDADFYAFWKSMESYRTTLGERDMLFLDTGGEYLRYLESSR